MKVELDAGGTQFGFVEQVRVLRAGSGLEHEVLEIFNGLPWLTKCRAKRWCRSHGYEVV